MEAEAHFCPHHPDRPASTRCQGCGRAVCAGCVVLLQGRELCQECKYGVLAGAFRVGNAIPIHSVETPVALETDARVIGHACATHPDSPAVTLCERCGDYMCPLCITAFQSRFYCTGCFDLMWQRGGLGASGSTVGGWALGLALLGSSVFVCVPFNSGGKSSDPAADFFVPLIMAAMWQVPALVCAGIELRRKTGSRSVTQSRLAWAALVIAGMCLAGFPLAMVVVK